MSSRGGAHAHRTWPEILDLIRSGNNTAAMVAAVRSTERSSAAMVLERMLRRGVVAVTRRHWRSGGDLYSVAPHCVHFRGLGGACLECGVERLVAA